MLVNIDPIDNLDPATPALWNDRFAAVANVLNGNIEAVNIKDGTITYSKMSLADKEIPGTKVGLTVTGPANNVGRIKLGELLIQWGRDTIANAGTTISFPEAYAVAPNVQLTSVDPNNWPAWLTTVTTTNFNAKQAYTGLALAVNWIAIGKAAT